MHIIPDDWGVHSFQMICGVDYWAHAPNDEVPTCLMCLGTRTKARAGVIGPALFTWSAATTGRSYSLRAIAASLGPGRIVEMDSNAPTRPRRV